MGNHQSLLNSSSVLVGGGTKKKDKKHVPPWLGMPTHLKARHLVVNIRIDRVGSQIGIRDNFPLHAGDTIWLSLLHEDGGVLGLALFPSKLDCEARMKDVVFFNRLTSPMTWGADRAFLNRPQLPSSLSSYVT